MRDVCICVWCMGSLSLSVIYMFVCGVLFVCCVCGVCVCMDYVLCACVCVCENERSPELGREET